MKKTLVALAVLAASGASFAQVTITGQYGAGYKSSTVGGADSSGLGISDSNIVFGMSEDLGGGMKASAQLKIDSLSRAGVGGGDSFVALTSSYGTLTLGQGEYDTDGADQFGTFMGATILGGGAYSDSERIADYAMYATSFGPVGVSLRHTEAATAKGLGVGAGGSAAVVGQRENTIAASYAAGKLSVKADYTNFDNKPGFDNRMTLGGNYDLGVAKLGLGFQNTKYSTGSALETFLGASIPFGALVVGIDYLNVKVSDTATTNDGTANGYGIQAMYNLSKRTDVRFRYASYDGSMNPAKKDSYTSLVMQHSF